MAKTETGETTVTKDTEASQEAESHELPKFIVPDDDPSGTVETDIDDDDDTIEAEDDDAGEQQPEPEQPESKPKQADDGDPDKRNVAKKVEEQGYKLANLEKTLGGMSEMLTKLVEQKAEPEPKTDKGKAEQAEQQQETIGDLTEQLKAIEDQLQDIGDDSDLVEAKQFRAAFTQMLELTKRLANGRPATATTDDAVQKRLEEQVAALQQRLDEAEAPKQEQAYFEKHADDLKAKYPNLTVEQVQDVWKSAKADIVRFKIADQQSQYDYWQEKLATADQAAKPKGSKARKADPPQSTQVSRPDESTEGTEITKSGASPSVPATQTDADEDGARWADKERRIPKFIV